MLFSDEFLALGAGAGILSLLWLIFTHLFGTYEGRTIRRILDKQSETFDNLLPQLGKLESTIATLIEELSKER